MKIFKQLREEVTRRIAEKLVSESEWDQYGPVSREATRATTEFINVLPHTDPKHRKRHVKEFNRISNAYFDNEHDENSLERLSNANQDLHELVGRMRRQTGITNDASTSLHKLANHDDPLHRLMGDRFHGNIQSSAEDEDHEMIDRSINDLHNYVNKHNIK